MTGNVRRSVFLFAILSAFAPAASPAADAPGVHFEVLPTNLPPPRATQAVDNSSVIVPRPMGARPAAPPGFEVSLYTSDVTRPRFLAVAPNGDVFVSESDEGRIAVLAERGGKLRRSIFARGFSQPHGIAFHDGALFVADTKGVWKLGYKDAASSAGRKSRVSRASYDLSGGHFTRDIAFGPDGTLYLAIGSLSNVAEDPLPRASVQVVKPDGSLSTFANGLRNPVGIAFYPGTDNLWVTVNERDGLGDDLPPDYLTQIRKGDFFGWPYAYIGSHPDPDFGRKRPDLVARTKTPDLLFRAHSAPLGLVFYEGNQFPPDYRGDAFVALHGSWNSSKPTGYKVVRVKFKNGRPVGGYDDFLTGFHVDDTSPARAWGRPVGLAVARDGSLLVSDDTGNAIWRVAYTGK